jgi:hypothetical protein
MVKSLFSLLLKVKLFLFVVKSLYCLMVKSPIDPNCLMTKSICFSYFQGFPFRFASASSGRLSPVEELFGHWHPRHLAALRRVASWTEVASCGHFVGG